MERSRLLDIDVLIITESKLDDSIPNNIISLAGFHEPIRHDRVMNGRHGGGVVMYIAEYLVFQHKKEFQSNLYEHIYGPISRLMIKHLQ